MKRTILLTFICSTFLVLTFAHLGFSSEQAPVNPIKKFLKNIEYTSRLRFEYDNNIFLTENDEDDDIKEIFTQTLTYRLPKENYYFQLAYRGNYAYYNKESTGILGHAANVLYSYRPFNGFSIGFRDDYSWLSDSTIASTIGDRVLSLGYIQNTPALEVKYEIDPRWTVTTDAYYQFLDVKDGNNDDYIDNKRIGAKGTVFYSITPNHDLIGFFGYDHNQITFPQITEKASHSGRGFVGLKKKLPNYFDITTEVGFENIYMDESDADDQNMDIQTQIETTFSVFTKVRLGLDYNVIKPSLRSEYSQFASTISSINLSHAINPKTSLNLNYSFEKQKFQSSNVLVGQADEDRTTDIHRTRMTLSRKLNSWLSGDFNYNYTQRNTDFANESYTNHTFTVGLMAKY
ncbi:MAG: hypothetical protein ABIJ41_00235 [Candidatus Omnitrophota bacterium]